MQLGSDGIDGIHDAVKAGKVDLIGVFRHIKNGVFGDFDIGVDIPQAGGHHIGLFLPDGGLQRHQLAVYVAFAHGIVVDERKRSDSGPAEGLAAPAAHAPQPEDGDPFSGKSLNSVLAQQQGGAFKPAHTPASPRVRESFC